MVFLKDFQISQKITCVGVFKKVSGPQDYDFIKKRLQQQVFSYEICEIFKNNYFEEHLRTTASKHI